MKDNKELEYRNTNNIEIRANEDNTESRKISGYAIRFNEQSQNLGFYEVIEPTAITQEQLDNSDIFACFNHDQEKVLARSINGKGTLKLEVRNDGVYYEFEAPHTTLGDELIEHIKRGEIFGSSFCFTLPVDGSGEKWEKRDNDVYYRTITHIDRIFEISPVFSQAYMTTSCNLRSKEQVEHFESVLDILDKQLQEVEELAKLN